MHSGSDTFWQWIRSLLTGVTACLILSQCATAPQTSMKPAIEAKTWRSFDGKEMPWKRGKKVSRGDVRAVVITVHGLSGAASDFWMLEDAWPERGIPVYGLELRGQGNDPVQRHQGNISSPLVWQKDLLTFHRLVRERHPEAPIFWYAESLGTLIAMHTVADMMPDAREHPAGLFLSAPAAGLRLRPSGIKSVLLYTAVAALPWKKVNLEKLAGVKDKDIRVTHDTTYGAQMAVTSHYVTAFTLRLLGGVDSMMRTAPQSARSLRVPVLMLASPNDVIASEEQVQSLFDMIASTDKELHWYRDSYHLLLHDVEREKVLRDATQWLEKHIKQSGKGP